MIQVATVQSHILVVRDSRAAWPELQQVDDIERQPCDLGELPSQGRFPAAGISEHGHAFHGVLQYHGAHVFVRVGHFAMSGRQIVAEEGNEPGRGG